MDIIVHDANFVKFDVIDEYESFIWTERFFSHGDFKIVAQPSSKIVSLLQTTNYISHSETDFVMKIEDLYEESKDGKTMITATGRTLTNLLSDRPVSNTWVGVGIVPAVIANLVQIICVDGTGTSAYDAIPGFVVSNIAWSAGYIETKLSAPQSLYKTVQEILEADGTGFSVKVNYKPAVWPNSGGTQLVFQIYNGTDRPELLFSVANDTLTNTSYLVSMRNYKNIAYVYHQQGIKIVPRPGVSSTVSGLARRVITVNATDVNPADHVVDQYNAILTQRALEAFASDDGKMVRLYDGEVPDTITYKYRRDYFLGDVVTYQGTGATQKRKARITEFIWSCDSQGTKAYPTFSVVD